MKTINFIYEKKEVEFLPEGKDNVMVNATQMAKIFNKQVVAFLRNETTKKFISECLKSENSHFLGIKSEKDLINSTQKSGTWMHRVLALKFAAWLDPAFELWVYVSIDRILNHYYREQRDAMLEQMDLKEKKASLKQELMEKHPEIQQYFELEDEERRIHGRRIKAVKRQKKQLQIEWNKKGGEHDV